MRWANITEVIFEEEWSKIEKECSNALQVMKSTDKFLYRGIKHIAKPIERLHSPSNRKSTGTPVWIRNKIDIFLKEKGFVALRSNSVYATTSYEMAYLYSDDMLSPYIIIPTNSVAITWSPIIDDLFHWVKEVWRSHVSKQETKLNEIMNKADYQSNNLLEAFNSGNEIMINGYYWIIDSKYENKIRDLL